MHIAFFSDQHPGTLGGLQVSLGTQRKHLESLGHTVTVCAPHSRRIPTPAYGRSHDVLLPSVQVGEQSFCFAGARFDRAIDAALGDKPPVDIVHVQADAWGAWNGYRFAARHDLPLAHTMHTNMEAGIPEVFPFPRAVSRLLFAAQHHYLESPPVHSLTAYLRAFAERTDILISPSRHFANTLMRSGITRAVHVLPTGVDDEVLAEVRAEPRTTRVRPLLVWPGRVSAEKRLGEFLQALALAQLDVDVHVYGSGSDLAHCRRLAGSLGIGDRVRFRGTVSHETVLRAIHQADGVVQSSLGYETQGLTVYEAASLGTPVILRDQDVSSELPAHLRYTAANGTITAFAHALAQFMSGCRDEVQRRPSDDFLQSSLSLRAESLYQQAVAHHVTTSRSGPHRLSA